MKKRNVLITVSSLLVLLSVGAFGQARRSLTRERRMEPERMRLQMRLLTALEANKEELKITDEQLENIRSLMDSQKETAIKMQADLDLKRLELDKLMRREQRKNYAEIEARMDAAAAVRQDMMIERMKNRDAIMENFTPEQHEAMKTLFKERREQREPFMRRGRLQQGFPRRDHRDFRQIPPRPRPPEESPVFF